MKRYEIRQISQNWYCIYDNVMHTAVIESTSIGIKVYAEILGIDWKEGIKKWVSTKKGLENVKPRSAWMKDVKEYTLEMLESIENADVIYSKEELKKAVLSGADSWEEYSYGGCALVYNFDIAEKAMYAVGIA